MNRRAKNPQAGRHPARNVAQIIFLLLFAALIAVGKIQLWLVLFALIGILGSIIFGRIYCSAVCPMGTLMRYQSWLST
ncbi:MAG: 4Fe-4S binding protein [Spirochaetales bacterium]|jgi:polyferredoxin|nr:4Fe-4S binding protein [Spirochaetales bacterium]